MQPRSRDGKYSTKPRSELSTDLSSVLIAHAEAANRLADDARGAGVVVPPEVWPVIGGYPEDAGATWIGDDGDFVELRRTSDGRFEVRSWDDIAGATVSRVWPQVRRVSDGLVEIDDASGATWSYKDGEFLDRWSDYGLDIGFSPDDVPEIISRYANGMEAQ